MSAFYIMRVSEETGRTAGALYIGRGVIAGVDIGEVKFDGQYTIAPGRMKGTVLMTRPRNEPVTLTFDWPDSFADGSQQTLTVEGKPVGVTLEKLRDLP